jgi:hypothetical protein
MAGADEVSQDDIEKTVCELAAERGVDLTRTHVLHVDPKSIRSGDRYKVDVRNLRLVNMSPSGVKNTWLHQINSAVLRWIVSGSLAILSIAAILSSGVGGWMNVVLALVLLVLAILAYAIR